MFVSNEELNEDSKGLFNIFGIFGMFVALLIVADVDVDEG
jgi:hypothetical protein